MKKTLLLLAAGAMALSSCTSEEVIEVSPQTKDITFKNVVNKQSRALDGTNLSSFMVYGYYTKGEDRNTRVSVFDKQAFVQGAQGHWETTGNKRYWIKGCTYTFCAYSCENVDIAPRYGNSGLDLSTGIFAINDYICHKSGGVSHDLIFASPENITPSSDQNYAVGLTFQHILAKVNIEFTSGFPEHYSVEISNVKLVNLRDEGNFEFNTTTTRNKVWNNVQRTTNPADEHYQPSIDFSTGSNNIAAVAIPAEGTNAPVEEKKVVTDYIHVIPYSYDQLDVKLVFDIKVTNDLLPIGQQTVLSNTLTGNWKPVWNMGVAYTYKVKLTGGSAGLDEIKFAVNTDTGVEGWAAPGANDTPGSIQFDM